MGLKLTGDFSVMTMKNDTKFEKEFACKFDPNTQKSQKFYINWIPLNKVYNV